MMHHVGLTALKHTDYTPIGLVNADPAGVHVRVDSPYKSVKDLLSAIKANPGKMKASGTGQGGIWHLAIAGLLKDQGIENALPWVPSNGAAPGLQDMVAGGEEVFGKDEIPSVSRSTIKTYHKYLKQNLTCPCLLTGIESIGFFRWEERFSFGYGSQEEYEQLKQKNCSFRDTYELRKFVTIVDDWDIFVTVYRIPHRKKFTIPLSELQAEIRHRNYQLLNDYTVWRVNWQ